MGLSRSVQKSIDVARKIAKKRQHSFFGAEHLLFALLQQETNTLYTLIVQYKVDLTSLRNKLSRHISEIKPSGENSGKAPSASEMVQRIIYKATILSEDYGFQDAASTCVVLAILEEFDSWAAHYLNEYGLDIEKVSFWIRNGYVKGPIVPPFTQPQEQQNEEGVEQIKDPLGRFTVNLTNMALSGNLDPLKGRETEMNRVVHILARRKKNNPMLVGDPGVGKTAIAEGLTQLITNGNVPLFLQNATVRSLDLGAMVAGTRYRGDFENRMKAVLDELLKNKDTILFIDEIHLIVGAGQANGNSMDAANLLKPALASGLKCIGATTYEEYRKYIEKDSALARRFQIVDIKEPSVEESVNILNTVADGYGSHHGVTYEKEALRRAAILSDRHIRDRMLPGKAIDVVDEAGATVRLGGRCVVTVSDIEKTISKMAKVPIGELTAGSNNISNLPNELRKQLFGQDDAVDRVSTSVLTSLAGLGPSERPIGSFLLVGPTGVGKTELARQLANVLGMKLFRLDMSEYSEHHTVSRLVGAPPGYIGFEQSGQLVNAVRETPHTVILLDEIEKAHPDVFNILLQIMDYGTLTDSSGKKADFRHAIILMTSNVGAEEVARRVPGFEGRMTEAGGDSVQRTFRPEFRNRLDGILRFKSLNPEVMMLIVNKFINRLADQLREKGISISVSDHAKTWLAENGYDPTFGARPMDRLIREKLNNPIAVMIISGLVQNGQLIKVGMENSTLSVKIKKKVTT